MRRLVGWPSGERWENRLGERARAPTLPPVEIAAIVGAAAAVSVAAAAAIGWRRAVLSASRQSQRADRAEATTVEQLAGAREEREVRDLVLSTMEDGILLIGRDGAVVFSNAAVGQLLLPEPASVETVLPLALRAAIEDSREGGAPTSVLVETGVPPRWLRGTVTPTADGATLVVVRDVTRQRQLESVRRDFVANASHELKTPAATIQVTAETLLRATREDPEAIPHFASQLEREAVRLSRIVADLLDLSRLESGSALDDPVSLGTVVREEIQRLDASAQRAGVALEGVAADVPPVRGSQGDLALLVRNLVDNAIRYSQEGGHVRVEVETMDGEVLLRVSDSGVGIPSKDVPRIFERFYRVDRARSRETGGTGLGLAIVKHVTENHSGRIQVESELGSGTTFLVTFPATPAS